MRKGKEVVKGESFKMEIEDRGWNDFIAAFEGKLPHVKVGIVGSTKKNRYDLDKDGADGKPKTVREAKKKGFLPTKQTNVTIGAIHEFGGDTTLPNGKKITLPQRSFLRYPISSRLYSYMKKAKFLREGMIEDTIENGNFGLLMTKIGGIAKLVVEDAFGDEGFGTWQKSNRKFKTVDETLVESTQLRNSISFKVQK